VPETGQDSGDLGTIPVQPGLRGEHWADDLRDLCLSFLACQEEADVSDNIGRRVLQ
jgi:hypothetical protein